MLLLLGIQRFGPSGFVGQADIWAKRDLCQNLIIFVGIFWAKNILIFINFDIEGMIKCKVLHTF